MHMSCTNITLVRCACFDSPVKESILKSSLPTIQIAPTPFAISGRIFFDSFKFSTTHLHEEVEC